MIYIVGTNHRFQVADEQSTPQELISFRRFIASTCCTLDISVIAEEMSVEAVAQRGRTESVCLQEARRVGLAHRYCDPDTPARAARGIREECDLEIAAFFGRIPHEDLPKAVRDEFAKREAMWLEELRHLDGRPVLFVCGARHALTFNDLLNREGTRGQVLVERWSPNPVLERAGE
jgi:hypothetical protein